MLTDAQRDAMLALLRQQPVAALATLRNGEPQVSMVPFSVLPASGLLVVHVSALALHTKNMQRAPRVSLMVMAPPTPGVAPQALPRVTLQCRAERCPPDHALYAAARQVHVARFPQAEPLFTFADFSLFLMAPRQARLVPGFGQATSLVQPALGALLSACGATAA